MTDVRTGSPDTQKEWDDISRNFIIANYDGQEGIDNDDGSCYYRSHHNFLVYSGNGMKVCSCFASACVLVASLCCRFPSCDCDALVSGLGACLLACVSCAKSE